MARLDEDPNVVVLEGEILVQRAIAAGVRVHTIHVLNKDHDRVAALSIPEAWQARIVVESPESMDRFAGFAFHRGMIGLADPPGMQPLLPEPGGLPGARILALPWLGDPVNVGTLARSALALGWDRVWLGQGCPSPWSRRVVRTSMGAILRQSVSILDDPEALHQARAAGLCVLGALAPGYNAVEEGPEARVRSLSDREAELARGQGLVLVLGHEYEGIPPAWEAAMTGGVHLPMWAGTDSLNVAAAGAILMYGLRNRTRCP